MGRTWTRWPLILALLAAITISRASGTTYSVENSVPGTPGGARFDRVFPSGRMESIMGTAKDYIVDAFSLSPAKQIDHVTLYVESFDGVAFAAGGNIHLSANYVEVFRPGDDEALRVEITGVMYHEMTHVVQNSAPGTPGGVIEGVADYIRLKAGYAVWSRVLTGNWDQGYAGTAYFFEWIEDTKRPAFVNLLNQRLGEVQQWSVSIIEELTGQSVDALWEEYKASF